MTIRKTLGPKIRRAALSGAIAAVLVSGQTLACTVVSLPGSGLVAKSYDWHLDHGQFLVNPRNVSKAALDLTGTDTPAQWTARYGSLTMNQYGREFPVSGMNEAGLVVEVAVGPAQHGTADDRPVVNELQWVQYQLDRFATVAEVLANLGEVRIAQVSTGLHYFIADRAGDRAVIEFLGGRAVSHSTLDGSLDIAAITNSSYAASRDHADRFQGFGGSASIPASPSSLDRFVRVAHAAQSGPATVDAAFEILETVRLGEDYTKWNIVYDDETVYFASSVQGFGQKHIDLSELNFSCSVPAQAQDVNLPVFGEVTERFSDDSLDLNREAIARAGFKGLALETISAYPTTHRCLG